MKAFLAALIKPFGPRELALVAGLALLAYGAYQLSPPAAEIVPGAILVYLAIVGLKT